MAIKNIADVHATWNGPKVVDQVKRAAGRGIQAAAVFYEARLKEILSVPAPRKRVVGKRGKNVGLTYYRATVAAVRGQPPRKLSGKLRREQTHEFAADGLSARVGTNTIYARRHEKGYHPYMVPTLLAHQGNLAAVVGGSFKAVTA